MTEQTVDGEILEPKTDTIEVFRLAYEKAKKETQEEIAKAFERKDKKVEKILLETLQTILNRTK